MCQTNSSAKQPNSTVYNHGKALKQTSLAGWLHDSDWLAQWRDGWQADSMYNTTHNIHNTLHLMTFYIIICRMWILISCRHQGSVLCSRAWVGSSSSESSSSSSSPPFRLSTLTSISVTRTKISRQVIHKVLHIHPIYTCTPLTWDCTLPSHSDWVGYHLHLL